MVQDFAHIQFMFTIRILGNIKLAETLYNVLPKADYCQNDYDILRGFSIIPNKVTWPIFAAG